MTLSGDARVLPVRSVKVTQPPSQDAPQREKLCWLCLWPIFLVKDDVKDMDSMENSEEKIQSETRGTTNMEAKEQTQTREITQTDHLNRRLLDAFLTRLNNSAESSEVPRTDQMEINGNNGFEDAQGFTNNENTKE